MKPITDLVQQDSFTKEDIIRLLQTNEEERRILYKKSAEIKEQQVGNIVYLRGLIEFSNVCEKDCLYCGIRKSNKAVDRYNLTDEEILNAVKFAHDNKYGSVVLQSGELSNSAFTGRIINLLKEIDLLSDGKMGVTLSLGEQTEEVYRAWREVGAKRYLLRIETTNKTLYEKVHPVDAEHSFEERIKALHALRRAGFQVGTGIMVGIPGQTLEDIANDILFMKELDIDMCGIGPYLENDQTPLYHTKEVLWPEIERFNTTLKVLAILRILMKDINIAASTALQAIDKAGREKAVKIAANIFMPNITPKQYRENYKLYANKPCIDENPEECQTCILARIKMAGNDVGFSQHGDSKHYAKRQIS